MHATDDRVASFFFSILMGFFCLLVGCADGTVEGTSHSTGAVVGCSLEAAREPTSSEAFTRLYDGRGFYTDGNHLGRDIALPEGTAIRPIGCGRIRIYRAAEGYGTLVVVIEHELRQAVTVRNGIGQEVSVSRLLTIYGHLRAQSERRGGTGTGLRVGDLVNQDTVIGYVQHNTENGDGAEHLHFGVRLQSLEDAQRADTNWFRGYDTTPSQRRWFADPADALRALIDHGDGTSCMNDAGLPRMDAASASVDASSASLLRYEFRVTSPAWGATDPFRLRGAVWSPIRCLNTGSEDMEPQEDGWRRCDPAEAVSPFVGSFTSSAHADWGDRGQIGTVGNAPLRCTPTEGVEWRITDRTQNRVLFQGPASDLPCMAEGSQDRHFLP